MKESGSRVFQTDPGETLEDVAARAAAFIDALPASVQISVMINGDTFASFEREHQALERTLEHRVPRGTRKRKAAPPKRKTRAVSGADASRVLPGA